MAVMKTLKSAKAGLVLQKGTDPVTGSIVKGNMSLGNIKETATDEAVYGVGAGLAPCLKYSVMEINRSASYALELE